MAKARAAKAYRKACWGAAVEAGTHLTSYPETIPLIITFHPPDRRRRDDDNMIASFKAGRDGIAGAMRRDDKDFKLGEPKIGNPVKGGCVVVTVGTL